MPDTQPPAFPGAPDEPTPPPTPEAPEAPKFPTTPQYSSATPPTPPTPPAQYSPPTPPAQGGYPLSDYGTPPPSQQQQQPQQGYPPANPYASAQYPAAPYAAGTISPKRGPNGLAVTAIILGGLALLGSFIPFLNYVTGFLAFIGLVFGVIGIFVKSRTRTPAIVGSILSFVALVLSIVLAIVYTSLFAAGVSDTIDDYPAYTSSPVEPSEAPSTGEQGAPAAGGVGSRENPAPIGSSIELTQLDVPTWQVTVNAPTFNADAEVAAENSFSDTPPAGTAYALLPLTMTYIGSDTGYPAFVQVAFEAADGTVYDQYDVVAIAPGAIDALTDLSAGESASGNVAIAVPTTGTDQGFWVLSSLDGTKFYFAAQ